MKAVVQRVLSSSVTIEDEIISEIGKGITALIAVESGDGGVQVSKMAEKLTMLREKSPSGPVCPGCARGDAPKEPRLFLTSF